MNCRLRPTVFFLCLVSIVASTFIMTKSSDTERLRLVSYNCTGAMSSVAYIEYLLEQSDILCTQEHHLYPDTAPFLQSLDPNFFAYFRCDSSLSITDQRRTRRGGVAVMWRKGLDYAVQRLEDVGNDRIIGISLTNEKQEPLYIFNVCHQPIRQ